MTHSLPGRIALVGSGEYLPVMHDVEAWLLKDRPPRYVQLATAAALEGDESLGYWHGLGAQASERLGVEQVVVDVRTREDAFEDRWVKSIEGAGAIYLSGGNPAHLATTLGGTPVWDAIVTAWKAGASLAGCSAGAMALSGYAVDLRHWSIHTDLQLIERVRVLPHFDRYSRWIPDFATRALRGADGVVLGIDESTALLAEAPEVGNQWFFKPQGVGSVWVVDASHREPITEGITLTVR
jgi:cyanophycinase